MIECFYAYLRYGRIKTASNVSLARRYVLRQYCFIGRSAAAPKIPQVPSETHDSTAFRTSEHERRLGLSSSANLSAAAKAPNLSCHNQDTDLYRRR